MTELNASSIRIFASVVANEPDADAQLFHRYLQRLCRLAQSRLAPRLARRIDAEDVVMSAYRSFFVNARAGRFWIQESGDLWALLTKITLRKLYRSAAHHSAEMRSVLRETALPESELSDEWMISEQPAAEDAVAMADEVETVLRSLSSPHRRIVELRLQGELMEDIAHEVELSERTVRRILNDLETQMRRRHGIADNESIRVLPCSRQPEGEIPLSSFNSHSFAEIQFEDLLLQKLIGAGGMGKVYRAIRRQDEQPVAVKFLHPSLRNRPQLVQQFLAEAEFVRSLDHVGIVKINGTGRTKSGVCFIVMELIEGQNLATELARQRASLQDIHLWIQDMASALEHAHTAGIVHCDLKPANILLNLQRRAVISDFGLAQFIRSEASTDTATAGTAPWMAPEQVDPVFGAITPQTDVYGLGAMLYSMLTGQPPFVGHRTSDVLTAVACQIPAPPSSFRPDILPDLDTFCLKCLAKRPIDRWASMREFLRNFPADHTDNTT